MIYSLNQSYNTNGLSKKKTILAMIKARKLPTNFSGNVAIFNNNVVIKNAPLYGYNRIIKDKFYYNQPKKKLCKHEYEIMEKAIENDLNIFVLNVPNGEYHANIYKYNSKNETYWIFDII